MAFQVLSLCVGPLQSNCHILYESESKDAIVFDPGDEGLRIQQSIDDLDLNPITIVNTHGHGDHIGANGFIQEAYDIPIGIHENEAQFLTDSKMNLSILFGADIVSPPADFTFTEEDSLELGGEEIVIFETSGHSPGGCSFLLETHLISGDALFKMSIGRTDFPGCSHDRLIRNIQSKLLTLPDETIIYPGHGPNTTVGDERKNNPYLQ